MHEMTLARNLLNLVLAHPQCREAGKDHRVETVRVRVGTLAGVEVEALRMGFAALARNTPAQGARLLVEAEAPWAVCACGKGFSPQHLATPCPVCGGHRLSWRAGLVLQLAGFTLEPLGAHTP